MLAFCGPVFITPGVNTYPEQMIDNGTYSLIDTGERRLLVTCHHVWQAYLDHRQNHPETNFGLNLGDGDATIGFNRPERHLIDSDADLDLAVFEFEPSQILINKNAISHQKNWFRIRHWPIAKAKEGDCVVLMGFPGKEIRKEGPLCVVNAYPIPLRVSSVGSRAILILNMQENVKVFSEVKNVLGGLSGSPAYTLGENGASLVGFVKSGYKPRDSDYHNAENNLFAGTLFLTHASFLQRDGTLVRPP